MYFILFKVAGYQKTMIQHATIVWFSCQIFLQNICTLILNVLNFLSICSVCFLQIYLFFFAYIKTKLKDMSLVCHSAVFGKIDFCYAAKIEWFNLGCRDCKNNFYLIFYLPPAWFWWLMFYGNGCNDMHIHDCFLRTY